MYANIELDGVCYASELHSNQEDKTAINTLDTYYTAMGFVTNIVRGGDLVSSPRNHK